MFNILRGLSQQDRERIKQKALQELTPKLQQLKGITKTLDKALKSIRDIESLCHCITILQGTRFKGFANRYCYACNEYGHNALIAIACGGCSKKYWVKQSEARDRWCVYCNHKDQWHTWWTELRNITKAQDFDQALTFFESPEQKLLALWRWDIEHNIRRILGQQNTQIIAYRCSKKLTLETVSNLGYSWLEFRGDPDKAFEQIEITREEICQLLEKCGFSSE